MSGCFRLIIAGACLLLILPESCSQDAGKDTIRLMFYNVENFFDTRHDSLKSDRDFLPGGAMRWNQTRYRKKLNMLFKTIAAAGRKDPPDLVGFCEIENRKVLEDLVSGTYLSKFNYEIVHEESPDQRGIDVCLIYRPAKLRLLGYRYLIPSSVDRESFTSRSVLFARFASGADTLSLFLNHWPSRRGGVLAGEELRSKISEMVRTHADSLMRAGKGDVKIIIAGDFNSTPDDNEIRSLTFVNKENTSLINLAEAEAARGKGTYRFMGTWEMLDQVIVSCGLMNAGKGLQTGKKMFSVFRPDFLLKKDTKYPGNTPFATYRGFKYQGGFSDHLPVLLDLVIR